MTAGKSLAPNDVQLLRSIISNAFRFDFNSIIEEAYFYNELSPALQQKI